MTLTQLSDLKPMVQDVQPITADERSQRLDKARRLLRQNNMPAMYLEAGTSLRYFTGIDHWLSERMIGAVLPADGELVYICPAFEEMKFREMLAVPGAVPSTVRVWEEHESPYALVAQVFRDQGIHKGTIGIEEQTRFFLFDGIRKAAPQLGFASADPITIPCRAYKSPAEIALMQRAMDITIEAYKFCVANLHEGMSQADFALNGSAAHKALGVQGIIGAQFGSSTAFPHGSPKMDYLKEGDLVLMDGSCRVDGYFSDISRVVCFGTPTQRMRAVWNLEKEAQAAAFAAAQVGTPCEAVDAAARKVITDAGFGPGYAVPGLPHRTGHGIGLDIHEWHNLVRGNKTPLAAGMCFTNEPMICIYGEFGVRLEDCFYMTEAGPTFFTTPSVSIQQPFG